MTNEDQVVEEFLEGQPRAAFWKELRESLSGRLQEAIEQKRALPEGDPGRAALDKRIAELRVQVEALAREEAITGFVEESVRSSLNRPRSDSTYDDGEEY